MRLTSGVCGVYYAFPARITNEEARQSTDQPPLTHTIRTTHLKFFGHIVLADTSMHQYGRALIACMTSAKGRTTDRADRVTPGSGPLNPI